MTSNANSISAAAKIGGSRAELSRLLLGDPDDDNESLRHFPRSKVLRAVTSKPGIVILTIAVGGLMLFRPTIAARAMRLIPAGAVMRMIATRFLRN